MNRGFDIDEITSTLPPSLKSEVFFVVHEHLLRQVPMFEECDDIFIKALVQQLKPQVLIKGDHAFRMNEPGDSMYFIQNGYIKIANEDETVVFCTLMPGE